MTGITIFMFAQIVFNISILLYLKRIERDRYTIIKIIRKEENE